MVRAREREREEAPFTLLTQLSPSTSHAMVAFSMFVCYGLESGYPEAAGFH